MAGAKVVSRLLWSLAVAAVLATGGLYVASRLVPDGGARAAEAKAIFVQLEAPGAGLNNLSISLSGCYLD